MKHRLAVSSLILILATLICLLSINGTYIKYDDHIPKLHGKKVSFLEEVFYININKDNANYIEEQKKYGTVIFRAQELKKERFEKYKTKATPIPNNMTFTVIKSFWSKSFGLLSADSGDHFFVVLEDEEGVASAMQWQLFYMTTGFTGYNYLEGYRTW